MALALEVHYGNAKAYVYDDLCRNLNPEEIEKRKLRVREAMGEIAASPGAAERLAAYREREKLEKPIEATYIWHREGKG